MNSKSLALISFLLFIFPSFGWCEEGKTEQGYERKTEIILEDLLSLVASKNPEKDDQVPKFCKLIKEKIDNKEMLYGVENNADRDVFNGASFVFATDGKQKPALVLKEALIDCFPKHRSLVLGILVHEIQHAFSFFQHPDYHRTVCNNPLEKFLFEMDAYFIEASFLRDYVLDDKSDLTPFEKLLLVSLAKDNLSGFARIILNQDRDLVYHLYGYRDDKTPLKETIDHYLKVGTDLIEDFKNAARGDSGKKVSLLISLRSFCKFGPQLLKDTVEFKDPKKPENFTLEYSPDFKAMISKMNDLLKKEEPLLGLHMDERKKFLTLEN